MSDRRSNRSVLTLVADGDRADAARRVLLADYCRLVGRRLSPDAGAGKRASTVTPPPAPADGPAAAVAALNLPPRLAQTLTGLLAGGSEKQIAAGLSISPHTVHAYVKELHKRLGVSSRGELLARFIGRS